MEQRGPAINVPAVLSLANSEELHCCVFESIVGKVLFQKSAAIGSKDLWRQRLSTNLRSYTHRKLMQPFAHAAPQSLGLTPDLIMTEG